MTRGAFLIAMTRSNSKNIRGPAELLLPGGVIIVRNWRSFV
jgi:hypothetical protein